MAYSLIFNGVDFHTLDEFMYFIYSLIQIIFTNIRLMNYLKSKELVWLNISIRTSQTESIYRNCIRNTFHSMKVTIHETI